MATAAESTKHCPKCGADLDPAAYASGQPFSCARCGARVQRNPRGGHAFVEPSTDTAEGDGELSWLGFLEDLLIKMIIGVFRFIFVKVPGELYRSLVRWFPTLVRFAKVVALLGVWSSVTFGPCAFSLQFSGWETSWFPWRIPVPQIYRDHAQLWNWCAGCYTALAVCGSIWGALYVRRRRKLARASRNAR